MDGALIFVLFAVIFITVAIVGYLQSQKRRQDLLAFCQRHNLVFDAGRDGSVEDQFPNFRALREGDDRYAYNIMRGDWNGRPLLAFDYHYETSSTDSKGHRQTHDHTFSAVILSSAVPLQPLFIRPEGFFDRIKEFFGFEDIDFESAEFSRAFHVIAPDKKWAFDVIHPRMMEFLLAGPRCTIQFDPLQVIAYQNRTLPVPEFEPVIGLLAGMLDRLPDYLVKQQAGEA